MAWTVWEVFKDVEKGDLWFHNFTNLLFLIAEITGENADDYIYTWDSDINVLDKPSTIIKLGVIELVLSFWHS